MNSNYSVSRRTANEDELLQGKNAQLVVLNMSLFIMRFPSRFSTAKTRQTSTRDGFFLCFVMELIIFAIQRNVSLSSFLGVRVLRIYSYTKKDEVYSASKLGARILRTHNISPYLHRSVYTLSFIITLLCAPAASSEY